MKRILFIHHAKGWGGAPINMINIIKSLEPADYTSEVLLLKESAVSDYLKSININYRVADTVFYQKFYRYYSHSIINLKRWHSPFELLQNFISWVLSRYIFAPRLLKAYHFDIVHINSSALTDWLAPCKKKGSVVIHVQEPLSNGYLGIRSGFLRNQMRKYADVIIAISKDNAHRIGLPDKTQIVYNNAEIPNHQPDLTSYSSKKFLYLGGADLIKGFITLVEALDYIEKDIKIYFGGSYVVKGFAQMTIMGKIKYLFSFGTTKKSAVEKMRNNHNAIEIGLTDQINFYLNEVCCLISPFSIPHFSRPVIEAFANRKPVIVTDIEGMSEVVKNNINGIIVPRNNPIELAKAINFIGNNADIALKMGRNGYYDAVEKYFPSNIEKIKTIYNIL